MSMAPDLAAKLRPVGALEVLVLVDNVTDALSTVPEGVINETRNLVKAGIKEMSGEAKCCAHHGFSLLIAAHSGSEAHVVLFDAGPEAYTLARNSDLLAVAFKDVEAVALSHGHWDHAGGLVEAVKRIFAANGGRRVPVHLNEGMLVRRSMTHPDGGRLPMKDVPRPEQLAAAGADVVMSPEARFLAGGFFYLSGEIPRITPYEKGLPGHMKLGADGKSWEPDPWISDERYLAVNVGGKGIVVFSMCSHAGVVNVLTDARKTFDGIPLHAVMGGLHLSGATVEPAIPDTIRDLMSFGLKRIVPAHCTGFRAFTALSNAGSPGVVFPSAVGRTFVF
jgi:7,8-dihydropterin-6-yl-methyl-4-(beta-D-ribofuranosyl)aminobenzene 5'-phosphate synthase